MAISTINQNGLNAPLTLTSPVLTTPSVTGGTFSSPTMTTPALGTPSAVVLTNATGLPNTALPSGTVIKVDTVTDTSQYAASPGAWNVVQLSGTFTFTMTNSANKLLILTNIRTTASINQGLIQMQYSNNGGSTWSIFPGRTNTNGTNNQITHGQAIDPSASSNYANRMCNNQFLMSPAGSTSWTVRVMGMVDSSGTMVYGRVANNNAIGTDAYSYVTFMEIVA